MKTEIHPKLHPVVFVDTSNNTEFITTSTLTSKETKKIDGVEHYVIKLEISSASHPFYTGKQKLIDTAGKVDKFMARVKKAQEFKAKQVKKVKEEDEESEVEEANAEVEQEENKPEVKKKTKKEKAEKAEMKEELIEEEAEAKEEEAIEEITEKAEAEEEESKQDEKE